ncbi:TetR/AcrR family transcriptional regulator [Anaerotignum sp. MB30-C6]|uniref:TetR/AcrR family transcriptional regulator n=1 Tax=Anaerotignum sp. MB30-C6 TaxID=3070814 RepID=UPI0027DC69EC|nr:TetR/AcrR family transcriptional regulator [Anaerotignum sp. MB30-C6]WMI79988.1 TetR/AcrR family transcriptional regulator [Anaerotignum sp. MB30-C6]
MRITQEEKELTKERIREETIKLFAQKGAAGISIREIAKNAGIGASTMYGYYPSKLDLIFDVLMPTNNVRRNMAIRLEELDVELATYEEIVRALVNVVKEIPGDSLNIDTKNLREVQSMILALDSISEIRKVANYEIVIQISQNLKNFFDRLKARGIMRENVDSLKTAEVIIDSVRTRIMDYITFENTTKEECFDEFYDIIYTVLDGKMLI